VAIKWSEKQQIVWPTAKLHEEGMKFSTEEFIDAVIKDVDSKHKLDPARIFTLSWSSSGPAAYAISLTSKKVTGSFIAMSVFKPALLPSLDKAKGHGYFLFHSPDDRVCPYRMAEQAVKDLEKNGATAKLETYEGGHGWRGGLYDHMREGIEWLEKNHSKPAAASEPEKSDKTAPIAAALQAEIEGLRPGKLAWREIKWESCLLAGLRQSRATNKPLLLWVFIDRPSDDARC
jgi:predicted esterase